MTALRAPLTCLTADELRVKVEHLEKALAELSLKELASHRSEMFQREEAVRDREVAVARREEEVGRREAAVARREEAMRAENPRLLGAACEEEDKAPWCEHSTPSVKHALLCTPTPTRSTLINPSQLQMTLKSVDDVGELVLTVMPPVPLFGEVAEAAEEPPAQFSSPARHTMLFSSPLAEVGNQVEDAARMATQHLDRVRRLSTPGKGNSTMLTAMFEQRVLDAAELKRETQPKRQAFRRRSSGSVGTVTSGRDVNKSLAPELLTQRSLASSSSASSLTSAGGLNKDRRPEVLQSARTSQSSVDDDLGASKQGPAPKVSLQELLRQDEERGTDM